MILQTLLLLGGAPLLTTALRPSESLETLPLAFHSGFADPWPRDAADIAYLARFRLVNLQLWEGPCWNATLAAAARDPPSRGPGPACGAESYQLDTLARVKAANPAVATTFYLNGFFQVRRRRRRRRRCCHRRRRRRHRLRCAVLRPLVRSLANLTACSVPYLVVLCSVRRGAGAAAAAASNQRQQQQQQHGAHGLGE